MALSEGQRLAPTGPLAPRMRRSSKRLSAVLTATLAWVDADAPTR
jgi:hypothetical protein